MNSIPGDLLVKNRLQDVVREAKDFALNNGICLRSRSSNNLDGVEIAPLTIFPTPFPRHEFELANNVQVLVNELMHKVAMDSMFLNSALESTTRVDTFTKQLLNVNNQLDRIGSSQKLNFGLFRTDYMLDTIDTSSNCRLKQVESNAIASGFAGLGPKVLKLHKYMMSKYCPDQLSNLPANEADQNFARSFVDTFDTYNNAQAVILVVTEDWTVNICDQRTLENSVNAINPSIKILRRTFSELHQSIKVSENRVLMVDGHEVALVYYRHCYDPVHYLSDQSWKLRLDIEMSKAIKCPSIKYHLSGVKKLQQMLSKKSVLEKFLPPKDSQTLIQTFTGLYGLDLDTSDGDDAVRLAMANPSKYVLKPQREGGGNNVYGSEIVKVLEPIQRSKEREAFILMDLIKPPAIKNYLIGPKIDTLEPVEIISELGIFGSVLGDETGLRFNRKDGHVLRSKKLGINEGGISAGFGAIDSPLLF